jgi:hypothetical protein
MDARRIHHSRRFAVLIILVLIGVALYALGFDLTSVQIAWHRVRLLSSSPETGVAQVEALAGLGDRGTPHLIWCVGHDVDQVQIAAIKVLADRKAMKASPALIRALDDAAAAVRTAANDALITLSGQDVGYNPHASWANRRDQVRAWEDWWQGRRFSEPLSAAPLAD